MRKLMLFLALGILLSSYALVLGVSPGRTTIDFKPNLKQTIPFTILNNEHKDMRLLVTVEGDIKDNVVLKEQVIKMKASEGSRSLSYDLYLPEKMNKPGPRNADIVVKELPPEDSEVPLIISGTVAVVTQLRVNVPYEGKYIEIENIEVGEAVKDEPVTFLIPIRNIGSEKLFKVNAKVEILGATNEVLAVLDTNAIALDPTKRELLKASWTANVNPGIYKANVIVNFDTEMAKAEKIFNVGALEVEIISIKTKNIELGGIAKMDIAVRSDWNEKIKDLYAELLIKTEAGDEVTKIKTPSIDLFPQTTQELTAYWDTEGLPEGNYYVTITVHFFEKQLSKLFVARLSSQDLLFAAVGPTGEVIFDTVAGLNRTAMLGILVVVLIVVNVGWLVFFIKRRRRNEEKKE